MLPDDVLLQIFNSHGYYDIFADERQKVWQTLVHVCRRWRCIVFGSPRRLNLQLVCTPRTPASLRDMLNVWPALPLIMSGEGGYATGGVDDIVAVLERNDHVCEIGLTNIPYSDLEILLATLQQPFPELTRLLLYWADEMEYWDDEMEYWDDETEHWDDETEFIVPDSFLGGSAPRLQSIQLGLVPFPGLPKLLLSATHLVDLQLDDIPHSGYFPPEAMVTALSASTSLDSLSLQFQSPRSCPDWASRRPPPSTRSVLPVLTNFVFKGVSEYLEDLVACIDTPQLSHLDITFFNDTVFDTPQLVQFINRTPTSNAFEEAHIFLQNGEANVSFLSKIFVYGKLRLKVTILCEGLDWQVSSLGQVCTSCLPLLSVLENLYINLSHSQPDWKDSIENGLWPELLRPFTAVKNFYLSEDAASHIAPAVQELCVEGRTTEVLPTLQNIFLRGPESSGPVQEGIGQFVDARQVAGHSIAVSRWNN